MIRVEGELDDPVKLCESLLKMKSGYNFTVFLALYVSTIFDNEHWDHKKLWVNYWNSSNSIGNIIKDIRQLRCSAEMNCFLELTIRFRGLYSSERSQEVQKYFHCTQKKHDGCEIIFYGYNPVNALIQY